MARRRNRLMGLIAPLGLAAGLVVAAGTGAPAGASGGPTSSFPGVVSAAISAPSIPGSAWTQPMSYSGEVQTTPTGQVVASSCSITSQLSADPLIQSFSRSGDLTWAERANVDNTSWGCPHSLTDGAGNTYSQEITPGGDEVIESLSPTGNARWTTSTGGYVPTSIKPVFGANGSIYFSGWNGISDVLRGYSMATGAVTLDLQEGPYSLGVSAYREGLIYVDEYQGVDYLDYAGQILAHYGWGTIPNAAQAFASSPGSDGTVFLGLNSGSCTSDLPPVTAKITPAGIQWYLAGQLPYKCGPGSLAAAPSGGVIVTLGDQTASGAVRTTSLSSAGTVFWQRDAVAPPGTLLSDFAGAEKPVVDSVGTVGVSSAFAEPCPSNPTVGCTGAQIDFYDATTGALMKAPWIVENFNSAADNASLMLDDWSIDVGRLYAVIDSAYDSQSARKSSISAFDVGGLTTEYQLSLQELMQGQSPPPVPTACGDAAILSARGSGETPDNVSFPGARTMPLGEILVNKYHLSLFTFSSATAKANGYEIGTTYPAIPVHLNVGYPAAYAESVDHGVENMQSKIRALRQRCGTTFPIFLTGYSQGADVVQGVLEGLDKVAATGDSTWQSIAGAVLLASTKFSPSDAAARGTFLGSYPLQGARLGSEAAIPLRFADRSRSYCLQDDPVCQFPNRIPSKKESAIHSKSYNSGSKTGDAIDQDGVGLLLWRLGKTSGKAPDGQLQAYRYGANLHVLLSAAWIRSNASPTIKFEWDFTGDGSWDATTTSAWVNHDYGLPLLKTDQKRVTTKVRITQADGQSLVKQICIRRSPTGSITC